MEKLKEKRTIEVNVIKFEDGTKIDSSTILRFIEEASGFEDTIGKEGNYTNNYLYFETSDEERKLVKILLKLNVIRKSPNHKSHNDKVSKSKYRNYYCYWLSDGYYDFCDKYWELVN